MKLYSYIVARDYGFAPNPFYGYCTLATCKPVIRRVAQVGDWIVGTGSKANKRHKNIVFAMRVTEAMTFEQYWNDPRFLNKRPKLRGSKKQAFGDNIYTPLAGGAWQQIDSHHSLPDGSSNIRNIINDTQTDRVLVSNDYMYWGQSGPLVPDPLRNFGGDDLCIGRRNHKSDYSPTFIEEFKDWIGSFAEKGCVGVPLDWKRSP